MAEERVEVKQGATERTQSGAVRTPYVDIYETGEGLTVVAELPGVPPEAVSVEVEKGVLTISGAGQRPAIDGYTPLYEGMGGCEYFRAFALSDEIDREQATANYRDGVLTVNLPRAAESRTRKIKVEPGK